MRNRCNMRGMKEKGDINPKDFILYSGDKFAAVEGSAVRDNTGDRQFIENLIFPTMTFPSDHAVLSCGIKGISNL